MTVSSTSADDVSHLMLGAPGGDQGVCCHPSLDQPLSDDVLVILMDLSSWALLRASTSSFWNSSPMPDHPGFCLPPSACLPSIRHLPLFRHNHLLPSSDKLSIISHLPLQFIATRRADFSQAESRVHVLMR